MRRDDTENLGFEAVGLARLRFGAPFLPGGKSSVLAFPRAAGLLDRGAHKLITEIRWRG